MKTIIAPIIGMIVIILHTVFKIDIPTGTVSDLVDVAVLGASVVSVIYGIFKNHFTPTA